jgi:very-short-patch-repair endonuclease
MSAGSHNDSKAGNRRGVVSAFKLEAVQARSELNPTLFRDGKYTYMVTAEGKKVYLSNSMQGVRFGLQCKCGQPHVRFATLHSIKAEFDLFCQWCECELSNWKGSNKDVVSESEKAAMQALQSAELDHTTACQVLLPFWHGRVDFYHIPSKTVIQVDGSSHFTRMHERTPQAQLLMDIECCGKAWDEGVRILRVHHEYGKPKEAMILATQLPYARFVMLAGNYAGAVLWEEGRHKTYLSMLYTRLGDRLSVDFRVAGCVIFF